MAVVEKARPPLIDPVAYIQMSALARRLWGAFRPFALKPPRLSGSSQRKTASIAVNETDGHWRVSYALLRKIVDI